MTNKILYLILIIFCGSKSFSQSILRNIPKQDYMNLIECIKTTDITTIRQGEEHKFIDMWMVVVEDRIFARSWKGSKNGWYYKFLKDNLGAIQCGDKYYEITGTIPKDLNEINEKINQAYLQKYGNGEYPKIARQMIEQDRMNRTIELIVNIKNNKNMNVPTEKQPIIEQLAQMAIKPFRTPLLKNPKDEGMDYQDVSFKTPDNVELKAWYIPAENSDKLIVVNHPMPMNRYGYPGHIEAFSQLFPDEVNFIKTYKQLHQAGYNVLTYDLRNHGESGEANGGICGIGMFEYQDAIGVMNYIKNDSKLSQMKVGFLSHCTGGNATLKALASEPELFKNVKALVVPQPCNMAYLVETFSQMFGVADYKDAIDDEMEKLGGLKASEMNPYPFAPKINIPTLISQVKDDAWTKPEDVQKTFDLIPTKDKKLVWIEGTNRRFDGYNYFGENPKEMIEWFNQFMND